MGLMLMGRLWRTNPEPLFPSWLHARLPVRSVGRSMQAEVVVDLSPEGNGVWGQLLGQKHRLLHKSVKAGGFETHPGL